MILGYLAPVVSKVLYNIDYLAYVISSLVHAWLPVAVKFCCHLPFAVPTNNQISSVILTALLVCYFSNSLLPLHVSPMY